MPGTTQVVRELHAAGIPLFGLTNWSDELYYPFAAPRFEVLRMLDDVVVSGEVRAAKPDPRAYEIVAERSGLPLDRLVFVDDKQLNVDAATALGMDGIVFTDAAALRTELRERRPARLISGGTFTVVVIVLPRAGSTVSRTAPAFATLRLPFFDSFRVATVALPARSLTLPVATTLLPT